MSNPSNRPKCPANGLERAKWYRREAEPHQRGGYWNSRLVSTAAAIELRIERESGMLLLDARTPDDMLADADAMARAAADVTGAHRAELLAGAATLRSRAVGNGHVTPPKR